MRSLPAPRVSTNRPTLSPCTVKSEMGRRSRKPPPGTATMTNCPGAAFAATRGATTSSAEKAPKRLTPATRQWDVSAHCSPCV